MMCNISVEGEFNNFDECHVQALNREYIKILLLLLLSPN